MTEFIVCCDDDSLALIIKLRTTCPPKYLQHVQYADINKRAFLCVIYLRALWRVITKKNHTIRINRLKMLVQFQLHMALDRVKRVFLLHRSISHLLLLSLACIFYYTRTCNEWEPCVHQAGVLLQYTWAVL